MKKMIHLLMLTLLISSILTSVTFAKKLKFAHVYETGEPFHQRILWAAEEIKKRTNGRYEVLVFPASSLGKEADINEGLNLGTVDLIYTGAGFLGRTYKPIAIGGAPYMFRDFDHWKKFYSSKLFKETLSGGYEKRSGHHIIAVTYYGARHVTSNKPIRTPADMKGLKIRTPNAPMFMMFPKAAGANPTPIAFAEVYLALQSGTVEAQENPLPTIQAKKFHEVQSHINLTGHILNELYTVASSSFWNSLTPADKEIFSQVFVRASELASNDIRYKEKTLVSWFRQQGINVIEDVDVKAMRATTTPSHLGKGNGWSKEIYEELNKL